MNALPDKPSDLIELALSDLEKCEKDDAYLIDMGQWHTPYVGSCSSRCAVCLAGSVMAKTLGVSFEENFEPFDLDDGDEDISDKLLALNELRGGWVLEGIGCLGIDRPELPEFFRVSLYEVDPEEFKSDMREMAQMLREKGL